MVQSSSKPPSQVLSSGRDVHSPTHISTSSSQPFSVYAGLPSYLQNVISQQRPSFFINEELRQDLIQRNTLTLATVDPALFPGKKEIPRTDQGFFWVIKFYLDLPQSADQYHELVPLEEHTLNQAIKSQTFGWVTSTYKATHNKTGLRYCLKRIHGKIIAFPLNYSIVWKELHWLLRLPRS